MEKTYLITRPLLAVKLYGAGKQITTVTNPYRDDLKAWTVPLDDEVCSVVAEFYRSIGKPVPKAVVSYREGGAQE